MKVLDEKKLENIDNAQKAKVKWSIEGDENSKFFHGIINKKRSTLAIRGMMVNGEWVIDPNRVKEEFRKHFSHQFLKPPDSRCTLNFAFPKQLIAEQRDFLDGWVSREEIRKAVWDCGVNKSPGPNGFTFDFFCKFWDLIGTEFSEAIEWFLEYDVFPKGCNSSFIALIPKIQDAKFCSDYRPISLIGNGPFILNELLTWCKKLKKQAMIFKVDFAKVYDSVRWDFLDDVLHSFGFGLKWRRWVKGCLSSAMTSILVNGSPSSEFSFERGLKQGDPLSLYLFILVMETLNLSFNRVVADGIYSGITIGTSMKVSHLFYADDVVFVGEWSRNNIQSLVKVLHIFYLASGLKINLVKSNLLGVGVHPEEVMQAANLIGCSVLKLPFKYLRVMIGNSMSRKLSWAPIIQKIQSRLSKWKAKTLSIGGRLMLLKSVLGATPIYSMSIYKVPTGILDLMESIRNKLFNGAVGKESKITWVPWKKVLAAKENGGLGISSYWALNRALLCKWIWLFLNRDNSLWYRIIVAIHGSNHHDLIRNYNGSRSKWLEILNEVHCLKLKGIEIMDHCKKRIGNGEQTLYALENNKSITVADKMAADLEGSFRRQDLNGDGEFMVKDVRNLLDEVVLPHADYPTRWVKYIPIKINIFAWKISLDRIPSKINLQKRGVSMEYNFCSICDEDVEDTSHIMFKCEMTSIMHQNICRWWQIDFNHVSSYAEWLSWLKNIRIPSKKKLMLEGVFYISWWQIWNFRNQILFGSSILRRSTVFDDIVARSFTYVSSRCKKKFSWIDWMSNPSSIAL
ncbi:RNA-directed DNA polymerase, eukaryota [Tanacetum coccineum]